MWTSVTSTMNCQLVTGKETDKACCAGLCGFWKQLPVACGYVIVTRRSVCKELEKELELQIGMKTEMEIAMKLLEKDTHEKQDTLVALRQQLEEVKAINLQMFHKSQVRTQW